MVQPAQPSIPSNVPLGINLSLQEIYKNLCPACREVLLDYIAGKAGAGMVRESLRHQLEASAEPEGPEDRRREHS